MNDLDQQLLNLVLTAQKYPPNSQQRIFAVNKLIRLIEQNPSKLSRPYAGQFGQRYDEIYQVGKQRLFMWLFLNIDKYKPERGTVFNWINFLFQKNFFNLAIKEIMGEENEFLEPNLDNLDIFIMPDDNFISQQYLYICIREYVKQDPDNFFNAQYINHNPKANFQFIFLRKNPDNPEKIETTFQDIANELKEKLSNITSFYYRKLKFFNYLLKFIEYYYLHNYDLDTIIINNIIECPSLSEVKVQDLIKDYVKEDPEVTFKNAYIDSNTKANFQFIFLQLNHDYSWQTITQAIEEKSKQKIKTFYNQCLRRFEPLFHYFRI